MTPHTVVTGLIVKEHRNVNGGNLTCWGGPALYAAVAAKEYSNVTVMSAVGHDFDAWDMLADLNFSNMNVVENWCTPQAEIRNGDAKLTKLSFPNLDFADQLECDVLVLGNMPPKWIESTLLSVRSRFTLLDSHAGWIQAFPEAFKKHESRFDLVSLTAKEWEIWESVGLARNSKYLRIVKRDACGVQIVDKAKTLNCEPPFSESIVDTTGCGDALLGGIAGQLANREKLELANIKHAYLKCRFQVGGKLTTMGAAEFGAYVRRESSQQS